MWQSEPSAVIFNCYALTRESFAVITRGSNAKDDSGSAYPNFISYADAHRVFNSFSMPKEGKKTLRQASKWEGQNEVL